MKKKSSRGQGVKGWHIIGKIVTQETGQREGDVTGQETVHNPSQKCVFSPSFRVIVSLLCACYRCLLCACDFCFHVLFNETESPSRNVSSSNRANQNGGNKMIGRGTYKTFCVKPRGSGNEGERRANRHFCHRKWRGHRKKNCSWKKKWFERNWKGRGEMAKCFVFIHTYANKCLITKLLRPSNPEPERHSKWARRMVLARQFKQRD